jgi:hypothetical protein
MYLNIFSNELPLFLFTVNIKGNQVKFSSHFKTEYHIQNVGLNIFLKISKMRENGQSFIGIAKSLWDQSFHSKRAASAARTSGPLLIGSSISF